MKDKEENIQESIENRKEVGVIFDIEALYLLDNDEKADAQVLLQNKTKNFMKDALEQDIPDDNFNKEVSVDVNRDKILVANFNVKDVVLILLIHVDEVALNVLKEDVDIKVTVDINLKEDKENNEVEIIFIEGLYLVNVNVNFVKNSCIKIGG